MQPSTMSRKLDDILFGMGKIKCWKSVIRCCQSTRISTDRPRSLNVKSARISPRFIRKCRHLMRNTQICRFSSRMFKKPKLHMKQAIQSIHPIQWLPFLPLQLIQTKIKISQTIKKQQIETKQQQQHHTRHSSNKGKVQITCRTRTSQTSFKSKLANLEMKSPINKSISFFAIDLMVYAKLLDAVLCLSLLSNAFFHSII